MLNLSFGWTWPALVAGEKTVTRRAWKDRTARMYQHAYLEGHYVQAWDRCPAYGGKKIGVIRLTHQPMKCDMADMPASDYQQEGFAWFYENPWALSSSAKKQPLRDCSGEAFEKWMKSGGQMWVVRFSVIQITPEAFESLGKLRP